jgi:hypothetical protein
VHIECEEEKGTGTIENSVTSTMGLGFISVHFLRCDVSAPAGQNRLISNSLILATAHSLLVLSSEKLRDDLKPEAGTVFSKVKIDNGTTIALNGSFNMTETLSAEINNVTSSLEFSPSSGSTFKLGGNPATYTDQTQTLMEGGGKIGVENGS